MKFASVCCDWMSGRHDYREPVELRESGRILKIKADGEIEFESQLWEQIRCPSSDTSIRIKCDGRSLRFMGNIGRFQQADNVTGLTVMQCVERWREVLGKLGFDVSGFGTRWGKGTLGEYGTFLTRIDLAGNFEVSDYSALCSLLMVRRIGQKLPMAGKYGPMWGYDSKRSNWWKAKFYDKAAEQAGKRRSEGKATLARFEVQLGAEYLKRDGLDDVFGWRGDDMANVIYARFGDPLFRESLDVQDWKGMPVRCQAMATMWRQGVDLRTVLSKSAYYRERAKLIGYGIDIGTPCNVMALTRHCRIVEVSPVSALREAA